MTTKSNFNVTCCYCGDTLNLVGDDDDNWADDLFDESSPLERECPTCKKILLIEVDAIWSYQADKYLSDEMNEDAP